MGLFGDIKQVVKKNVQESVDSRISDAANTKAGTAFFNAKSKIEAATGKHAQPTVMLWAREPFKATIKLMPIYEKTFYTYYSEPMRKLRIGDVFLLEAVPGDAVLHSSYSGNTLETVESDMLAYSFDGQIVGASNCFHENVENLLRQGYRVFLEAEKTGVLDKDIPTVVIRGNYASDGFDLL